jgi:hypothetical protein
MYQQTDRNVSVTVYEPKENSDSDRNQLQTIYLRNETNLVLISRAFRRGKQNGEAVPLGSGHIEGWRFNI